jgi:TatD DNase family protein
MVDCHCHVADYPPATDWSSFGQLNMGALMMTTSPEQYLEVKEKQWQSNNIIPCLGFFPLELESKKQQIDLFFDLMPNCAFIGEVGMDFSTVTNRDSQWDFFKRLLCECRDGDPKVVSIHSRRCGTEVLHELRAPLPGAAILHWFSGPKTALERLPEHCFLSINTAMLASKNGKALLKSIPKDRCLLESDGPYVQFRGRAAHPTDLAHVIDRLAALWAMPRFAVRQQLQANLERCLEGIDPNQNPLTKATKAEKTPDQLRYSF